MEYTRDYLQDLIDGKVEESAQLEYKAAGAMDRISEKKTEITKDISSFANAAGGVLIYGIRDHREKDKKHLPEKLDPVDQGKFSREWLDQIAGQIQPRIDLKIHPVHVGPASSDYCYVVEIPPGETAHQALDMRYYRRRNFEVTAMEDYEIREAMNRRKHPVLSAFVKVRRDQVGKGVFMVFIKNKGRMLARHYAAMVDFPALLNGFVFRFDRPSFIHEIEGGMALRVRLNGVPTRPLFPDGDECRLDAPFQYNHGHLRAMDGKPAKSIEDIRVTLFADEMRKLELRFNPADVMMPVETLIE